MMMATQIAVKSTSALLARARLLAHDEHRPNARPIRERASYQSCGMVESRTEPCALEGCCARFCKGKDGHCASTMPDVFDCFVDAEDDGTFRLKNLCAMGD